MSSYGKLRARRQAVIMSFLVKPQSELHAFLARVRGDLDVASLPAFLRVLLTTDGTVTNSLEAFFWEPVAVETIAQREMVLVEDTPHIERSAGDTVLARRVQLRGLDTDTRYVEAESLIRLDLLPANFQDELVAQKMGIGELLRDCGLETYREILEVGCDEETKNLWRTYRIVTDHHPFIQITEHFPLSVYR